MSGPLSIRLFCQTETINSFRQAALYTTEGLLNVRIFFPPEETDSRVRAGEGIVDIRGGCREKIWHAGILILAFSDSDSEKEVVRFMLDVFRDGS